MKVMVFVDGDLLKDEKRNVVFHKIGPSDYKSVETNELFSFTKDNIIREEPAVIGTSNRMSLSDLSLYTLAWANDKGLNSTYGSPEKQFMKMVEEVGEVGSSYLRYKAAKDRGDEAETDKWWSELQDGIGDTAVTLQVFSHIVEADLRESWNMAYNVISARKGKTIGGTFVKEEDL